MKSYKFLVLGLCSLLAIELKAQTDSTNCPTDTLDGEIVYKYEVEKSIGLYRIGVNFGVPQSEIIRLNPQLKERGLRFGETLYIPTGRKVERAKKGPVAIREANLRELNATKELKVRVPADTVKHTAEIAVVQDSMPATPARPDTVVPDKRLVELALLLPFESGQSKQSQNAERIMAFYQGVLLALHDSQNATTRYRLHVYDTGRSERVINQLCDSNLIDSVQAVLGVAYPIQIERMAGWCRAHNVPMLVPFSSDIDLVNQPNVLQFNSSDRQAADSLCDWIQHRDSLHCVLVETNESETATAISILRDRMKARHIPYRRMAITDLKNDSATYALDSLRENLVILPSDRYQHIHMLLPHLEKLQANGYRIRIVGQYSWQKEDIRIPMVYTSVFTASANQAAYEALWNRYYASEYVSETPRYDLLGYDLAHALLGWLQGQTQHEGLQSNIRWQRIGNGGWQNTGMKVVEK